MQAATVCGLLIAAFGVAIVVTGKVGFGPEGGDDSEDRWVEGVPARRVGAGILLSGVVMVASPVAGCCLLLGAFALAWWVSR